MAPSSARARPAQTRAGPVDDARVPCPQARCRIALARGITHPPARCRHAMQAAGCGAGSGRRDTTNRRHNHRSDRTLRRMAVASARMSAAGAGDARQEERTRAFAAVHAQRRPRCPGAACGSVCRAAEAFRLWGDRAQGDRGQGRVHVRTRRSLLPCRGRGSARSPVARQSDRRRGSAATDRAPPRGTPVPASDDRPGRKPRAWLQPRGGAGRPRPRPPTRIREPAAGAAGRPH